MFRKMHPQSEGSMDHTDFLQGHRKITPLTFLMPWMTRCLQEQGV